MDEEDEFDAGWEDYDRAEPDCVDLVLEAAALVSVFAAERLRRVDGMRRELLREAAGRGSAVADIVERSIRLELAAAMRVTEYAAERLIRQAEALVHRYPDALSALSAGNVTEKHAEILVDLIDQVEPALRLQIVERAVHLAKSEPVGTFRRSLRALIETVQAPTLEDRHRAAVQTRRLVLEAGEDCMSALMIFLPSVEAQAIYQRATAIAKVLAAQEGETRTLDQLRADIVADLLIDGTTDHLPATASGIRASVVVTVPALALLDDEAAATADPPVVEGVGPIPLSRARELCGGDSGWTRILTHPETGIVLSVGREKYRAPAPLRQLVKWRADRCMAPGCGMPASRCEIDHQVAWEHDGDTCLGNLCPFCKGHHIVKHHGDWIVRQIPDSGGAVEWISPTGRRYVVEPERRVPVFTVSRTTTSHGVGPEPPF